MGLTPASVLYVDAVRACKAAGKMDQVCVVYFCCAPPPLPLRRRGAPDVLAELVCVHTAALLLLFLALALPCWVLIKHGILT